MSAPTNDQVNVGLALSGGGIRALVFHLGVFKCLAEIGYWERISIISSVSGGSLAVGLILALGNGKWPSSVDFLTETLSAARQTVTGQDIQNEYVKRVLLNPFRLLGGRANIVGDILQSAWGLKGSLRDLPDSPKFRINCTTYETGKNWRFSKEKMGDYLTGYIPTPDFPIAHAIAASAAFPGLIGPLKIWRSDIKVSPTDMGSIELKKRIEALSTFLLWDGGIYENLGVESLFKNRSLQNGVNFLLVSDASGLLGVEERRWSTAFPFYLPPKRLIDIATDQTRALRARDLIGFFAEDPARGRYLYIANSVPEIFRRAKKPVSVDCEVYQSDNDIEFCKHFKTTLHAPSELDYDRLFVRGYEVAKATVQAY